MRIPGYTSTGSKRPEALFGVEAEVVPRMVRSAGCRLWDANGREYIDLTMALGAVALGYGHPAVADAVAGAARDGGVGGLAPALEDELATRLTAVLPGVEAVRFLKTGAEAVAAAVRLARVVTGRQHVATCGYHGWLDWCADGEGVPAVVRSLRRPISFNDVDSLSPVMEDPDLAAVVVEPVIDGLPDKTWLLRLREESTRRGVVLVFDEIKTAFRVARGGVAEVFDVVPDLLVVGKALGNGLPLAAVGGTQALMNAAGRTWISSTLSTEWVSLAAASAVLEVYDREPVLAHLRDRGSELIAGLRKLADAHSDRVTVRGIPEMCYLAFENDADGGAVARKAAARGVLLKRMAYNFVSYAHTADDVARALEVWGTALEETQPC